VPIFTVAILQIYTNNLTVILGVGTYKIDIFLYFANALISAISIFGIRARAFVSCCWRGCTN